MTTSHVRRCSVRGICQRPPNSCAFAWRSGNARPGCWPIRRRWRSTEIRQQGTDSLAVRAAKKLKNEELLMVQLGGTRLRHELDRVPLWRGDHVGIKQLAEDMGRYLYLPRLRDEDVLLAAIREGLGSLSWSSETFAYAEGWDETRRRYKGLKAGQSMRVLVDGQSLLVKAEAASAQMQADLQHQAASAAARGESGGVANATDGGRAAIGVASVDPDLVTPAAPQLRRFHASVTIDHVTSRPRCRADR
jgi:hypothetical protein